MTERLVSVIIPAFNAASSIRKTIESVLQQTHPAVETIVVDDGSTDHTREVLASFGKEIHCYGQENRGPAAARNKALGSARGQYIMFLDADDLILPEKIRKQVEILETTASVGWTYCDVEYVDERGEHLYLASDRFSYSKRNRLDGFLFSDLLLGNFIPVHAPLIRRHCLDAVGPFDEDPRLIGVEDWDLFLRLGLCFRTLYSPLVLATCAVHSGSLSADPQARDRRRFHLLDKAIQVHQAEIIALGLTGRRVMADTHNWFAYRHLDAGEWKEALHRLKSSLTIYPFQRRAVLKLLQAFVQGAQTVFK